MLNRYLQIGVVALSLGLLAALFATTKPGDTSRPDTLKAGETEAKSDIAAPQDESAETKAPVASQSRAILSVQGMTCSGCIAQIKSSLAGLEGIGDVRVDLANGQVEVRYDSERLKDTERIAAAITGAGYPATLKQVQTAKEIADDFRLGASKSKRYIARVGDLDILRSDYDTEMNHARKRYERVYGKDVFKGDRGNALLDDLQSQVALRLIDEGVQLNEIRKTDYKLDTDTLKNAFDEFLNQRSVTPDEFKRTIVESGLDYDYFLKKFKNRVTINTYVEEKVLSGLSNEQQRQQQYQDWFNNARLLANTVYYDKDVENFVKNSSQSSGCRSACTKGNDTAKSGCKSACVRKSSASKAGGQSDCVRKGSAAKSGCPGAGSKRQ
jgi:copper chaperone